MLSAALSGTVNMARLACQHHKEFVTFVYDTKVLSMALGYIVSGAVELLKAGASFEALEEALPKLREDVDCMFYLPTLDYLIAGGRIGRVAGMVGMTAHFLGQHGHFDVLVVLEAVADDGRFVVGQGHDGHQFRFRAGFQAEPEGFAELQHLFNHLALLVDLDGVHAVVAALVFVLGDRHLERFVDFTQAVLENVGKPDENRQVDAAQNQRIHQLLQVDRPRGILFRVNAYVPVLANGKVALPPARDIVEVAGKLGSPSLGRLHDKRALTAVSFQLIYPRS
jgi:hypothetical protein